MIATGAMATTYQPGETLNPACLPTDATCVIATSTASSFSVTQNGLSISSSSPVSATHTLYNIGGTLFWNGTALSKGALTDWEFFNTSDIRLASTTHQLLIGAQATSTNAKLEVVGLTSLQGLTFTTATGTSATTTDFYSRNATLGTTTATNLTTTNATSTNFYTSIINAVTGVIDTLTSRTAILYNATVGALTATSSATFYGGLTSNALTATSSLISQGTLAVSATSTLATTTATAIAISGSATSTFSGGLQALALNVTSATSTFANGLNVSDGCVSVRGACLTDTTGITSINAVTSLSQSFASSNGLNTNLSISSSGSTHTFALSSNVNPLFSTFAATSTLASSSLSFALNAMNAVGVGHTATTTINGDNATSTFAGGVLATGLASSNGITLTGGTFSSSGVVSVSANATSTFSGGITAAGFSSSNGITLTGGSLNNTSAATSTFANGIQLSAGCFKLASGGCAADGGATGTLINNGTANQLAYYSASNALNSSNFLVLDPTNNLFGIGTTTPGSKLAVQRSEKWYEARN